MNKLIMGIAALVLITAPARAEISDAVLAAASKRAKEIAAERAPKPQIIKVYVYSIPVGGPIAPRPKPQAAPKPAPQFKPAPRTQAVKLEER